MDPTDTTQYQYDWDNHLTQVSDNTGLLGQYGYSGDGLRVAKATAQAQAASSMTATG